MIKSAKILRLAAEYNFIRNILKKDTTAINKIHAEYWSANAIEYNNAISYFKLFKEEGLDFTPEHKVIALLMAADIAESEGN